MNQKIEELEREMRVLEYFENAQYGCAPPEKAGNDLGMKIDEIQTILLRNGIHIDWSGARDMMCTGEKETKDAIVKLEERIARLKAEKEIKVVSSGVFSSGTTTTHGQGAIVLEFPTGSMLTVMALPEKDGEERNKIAYCAASQGSVQVKDDIKASEAMKKLHEMRGTSEQIEKLAQFLKENISKSKIEKETSVGLKAGTTGIEGEAKYIKRKTSPVQEVSDVTE